MIEFDVAWCVKGGEDPVTWIAAHGDRIASAHDWIELLDAGGNVVDAIVAAAFTGRMVFGGTGLSIIAVYILSGHLAMAAMLLLAAMRGVR